MVGMCVHLLSRYFHTVTHYSVLAEQNQPLFLFFLQKEFMLPPDRFPTASCRPEWASVCLSAASIFCFSVSRPKLLHKSRAVVIITTCEKVAKPSKAVVHVYVNQKPNIHRIPGMWITPVDKAVDNVENFDLSTGIPAIHPLFTIQKPLHISMHIFLFFSFCSVLRHHFMFTPSLQKRREKVGFP